ncbi:hypothetical protein TDB9533_03169 [Thalassocella blandensis]|nr:hypothetical protein TDB9533_03169 [Thalassocella blandensis]
MLLFVAEAFKLGALAIKGESSGIAHGKLRWLELSERSKEPENQLSSLYRAWVRLPISDDSKLYSVGMHLIGMKDAEINNGDSSIDDLDMFLLYLVVDLAEPNIKNGQTFSKDNESTVYTIKGIDCNRYESDDFFIIHTVCGHLQVHQHNQNSQGNAKKRRACCWRYVRSQ